MRRDANGKIKGRAFQELHTGFNTPRQVCAWDEGICLREQIPLP